MFGSDWPVCLVACEYAKWVNIVKKFISSLSESEQGNILYNNSLRIYKLKL